MIYTILDNTSKRKLVLEPGEHIILMHEVVDISEGYYTSFSRGVNTYIYNRGDRFDALIYDADDAVDEVLAMRRKGYPASIEPPVTITL